MQAGEREIACNWVIRAFSWDNVGLWSNSLLPRLPHAALEEQVENVSLRVTYNLALSWNVWTLDLNLLKLRNVYNMCLFWRAKFSPHAPATWLWRWCGGGHPAAWNSVSHTWSGSLPDLTFFIYHFIFHLTFHGSGHWPLQPAVQRC